MFKFIFYITLAAAIAGTACGKRESTPKVDTSWGIDKCIMKEEFRMCVASLGKTSPIPKDAVEQCESAARTLSRTREYLIIPECKGY